ncbi:MAG: DUF262 domain-containing protein [Bacteroidales bacterium]|nr:DUF262 domain-containing protein [Bacteroidales bacterium]
MNNCWKIGSRWSVDGSWNSRIITIFRRSNVVFVGGDAAKRFHDQVKKGDYFAIADGFTIVAVARATGDVMRLPEMIEQGLIKARDGEPFDLSKNFDGCYGIKVKIVDLPKQDQFQYRKRGTFFSANKYIDRIKDLYDTKSNKIFDIAANTYRLISSGNIDSKGYEKYPILDGRTKYIIPVYQREYSWGPEQVSRFIRDIFRGFWGVEDKKELILDPMFIGTMQLSFKKYISPTEYEQDIIDGQQRLSTFMCLIVCLKLKYAENEKIRSIQTDWLETRVNNGKEDKYLCEMRSLLSLEEARNSYERNPNKYIENLLIIDETFSQIISDENDSVNPFFEDNLDEFLDYLFSHVYMVVVETVAGLSKTIQIFNTINTTGLDLDGNDLFKVRLYEYLRDIDNADENAFNKIGDLYKRVKDINEKWRKNHNFDVVTMHGVRSTYKNYLIAKYNLSSNLYQMGTDRFFEYLFDVLLNVQEHKEIKNTNELVLSLEDINDVIGSCVLWKSHIFETSAELISKLLINKSRYGRYSSFAYQIMLATKGMEAKDRISAVNLILDKLSRVFFCYSILYSKQINEIHSFMNKANDLIINEGLNATMALIDGKLNSINQSLINNSLGGEIAHNRIWKDLICCLSAFFDEEKTEISLDELEDKLSRNYDIEHIHATADEIIDFEKPLQNSIGNLMLLEYDINRSIGSKPFEDKVHSYKNSKYATAKKISKFPKWDTEDANKRRKEEIDKIIKYLFGS